MNKKRKKQSKQHYHHQIPMLLLFYCVSGILFAVLSQNKQQKCIMQYFLYFLSMPIDWCSDCWIISIPYTNFTSFDADADNDQIVPTSFQSFTYICSCTILLRSWVLITVIRRWKSVLHARTSLCLCKQIE